MKHCLPILFLAAVAVTAAQEETDSVPGDILPPDPESISIDTLTNADLDELSLMLDVDVPALQAVLEIEAGPTHQGFWAPGKPLVNFDLNVFRKMARRHNVNLSRYSRSHAVVFNRPDIRRYGSMQAAQHARLEAAMTINAPAAIEGTFWGMFQIGGFNWCKCGAESPEDFRDRMCRSERDQLLLFANFLQNTGLDAPLRRHDWRAFARGYNGSSYARRGYHTKLDRAYRKHLNRPFFWQRIVNRPEF